MDPALLICEGSPSTPPMNLQLLEFSNKRATGNIVIHKSLIISALRNQINALSRPVHGFESRTRCQFDIEDMLGVVAQIPQ
jgi:hypothetical protein